MGDYWMFEESIYNNRSILRFTLEDGGHINVPKNATIATLKDERNRMQRELLHYDARTMPELERFVRDRRLQSSASTGVRARERRTTIRKRMINLLEDHDDNPKLDRFLELPAELKAWSLSSACISTVRSPCQSRHPSRGRTATSASLRCRSFTGRQTFQLFYEDEPCPVQRGDDELTFKLGLDDQLWLGQLPQEHSACIRSFSLASSSIDSISIDLDKWKAGFRVTADEPVTGPDGYFSDEQRQGLIQELSKMLEKVEWVEGLQRFTIRDIYAIRMALKAAFVGLEAA